MCGSTILAIEPTLISRASQGAPPARGKKIPIGSIEVVEVAAGGSIGPRVSRIWHISNGAEPGISGVITQEPWSNRWDKQGIFRSHLHCFFIQNLTRPSRALFFSGDAGEGAGGGSVRVGGVQRCLKGFDQL